jgi:hypothetical protein
MPDDPNGDGDDLGAQLGRYIDAAAPAVTLDEIGGDAVLSTDGSPPSAPARRWTAAVAVAAGLVLVLGTLAIVRRAGPEGELTVGPATTAAPAAEDLSWLSPLGPERPAPNVPAGWKVLDYLDMRFAVPADWATPISGRCAQPAAGVVLTSNGAPEGSCSPEREPPASTVVVEPATAAAGTGTPENVGTFAAERLDAKTCPACTGRYRLANGFEVSATGPDAGRVLATFTDSGRQRALQSGPVADSAAWRTITFADVSFDVPPEWGSLDLVGSYSRTTSPDGSIRSETGHADPGACDHQIFPPDASTRVFLGTAPMTPSCPYVDHKGLDVGDGAWISSEPDGGVERAIASSGRVRGIPVDVLALDPQQTRSAAPVELLIHAGATTQRMTIGVGLDPSIARAILRSIRPAGAARTPTPTSVTGPGTTARPVPGDPYCAAVRSYLRDFSTQRTVAGGSDVTYQVAAVDESRRRLHEIASLAPPDVAADWATLADVVPGQEPSPEVYRRIDTSVVQRCRITMAGTEVDHPGTTPTPGVTTASGP